MVNALVDHTGGNAAIVFDQGARYRLLNTLVAYHNYRVGVSYSGSIPALPTLAMGSSR